MIHPPSQVASNDYEFEDQIFSSLIIALRLALLKITSVNISPEKNHKFSRNGILKIPSPFMLIFFKFSNILY